MKRKFATIPNFEDGDLLYIRVDDPLQDHEQTAAD